jgi:hypothetical protein
MKDLRFNNERIEMVPARYGCGCRLVECEL